MAGALFAQSQPGTTFAPLTHGMVLTNVERSQFHSRFTGQDYNVYVSVPTSYYQGSQRYPVLYVPDADLGFLQAQASSDAMNLGSMLEEFILVGVPLKVDGTKEWSRLRLFDLTPTNVESFNAAQAQKGGGTFRSGGAPLFLRTLREELIPFLESKYRVTADRGLLGYSLGGLFAAYVLLSGDETFSRYLIGSPSLWWDDQLIIKTEAALAASGKKLHGRLFLSVGGDEGTTMVQPVKSMSAALTSHQPGVKLDSYIFDGNDHLSGVAAAVSRGIKVLYGRPAPSSH
jgi:hypothetical protein